MRVQGEVSITWDRESVDRKSVQQFRGFDLGRDGACAAKFGETIGYEEYEDDESAIGRAFDLEIAKQRVGTK
jgi:hypothetical protein